MTIINNNYTKILYIYRENNTLIIVNNICLGFWENMKNISTSVSSSIGQTMNSQSVQMDLSILRPAIAASVTGFLDVIKAFKNGTTEVINNTYAFNIY